MSKPLDKELPAEKNKTPRSKEEALKDLAERDPEKMAELLREILKQKEK